MAFDGITISSIVNELNDTINGGRLYKISQPEADEIMLTNKDTIWSVQTCFICKCIASSCISYRR